MDVTSLLNPRSDEMVSGENLEYETLFTDLELAAQPGEERQEGDKILPAEDPDWSDVRDKALGVLEVSHDLRAAVYFGQASLHSDGLVGLDNSVAYVVGCLSEHWETCHPQPDEDDGDVTMRVNAIRGLAGSDQVIRSLRSAALTDSRMFGRITLRDMEIADGTVAAPSDSENLVDTGAISAALQDTDPETLAETLQAAKNIRDNVQQIDAIFMERMPGEGPNLDLLSSSVSAIIKRLSDTVGDDTAEAAEESADGGAPAGAAAPISGQVNSPADVTAALDKIIGYYHRSEPSSPVPILLERAKKLVGADFMAIMNDMAPRGLEDVNFIGGITEE